jgi:hypothetical protein
VSQHRSNCLKRRSVIVHVSRTSMPQQMGMVGGEILRYGYSANDSVNCTNIQAHGTPMRADTKE